ncbi:hypothetical protein OHS33_37430 (plasmid) [Streptomyces sp. NBC_00536]|uniref:hypothetical protein n=1 Tax=Streptomyces sp. NBC_00536 TaxID=2975769 RepID=UPI002E80BB92|nr:hypothetical protein [Streptomyces sp. NBC_00536]WUC84091.1 hypothetical protein OHS33_37430 [Streptomyces sp. NBC_00536]
MTAVEAILARALLVRDRAVPRDIVRPDPLPPTDPTATARTATATTMTTTAAEHLRALCETLVTHTPAVTITKFVTDQVPEPRSALVLACVLQLTEADDGARFWWQYAAGAGQATAAYCLYLHHLSLGETDAAQWWHRQTDDVQPPPTTGAEAEERITSPSTTTILRVLHRLAAHMTRHRSPAVTELMTFMPTAVATGYLREPEMDLPMPGPDFATRIRTLLTPRPHTPTRPPVIRPNTLHPLGETATR